jgi:hypothetical protein
MDKEVKGHEHNLEYYARTADRQRIKKMKDTGSGLES